MLKELYDSENFKLQFEAVACMDKGYAFAAESQFNGLFQVDLESGESIYLGPFPDEPVFGTRLFFSAAVYRESIFFPPAAAKHIAKYNVLKGEFEVIALPVLERLNLKSQFKFSDAFVFHDKVFFVGASCPYILQLNPDTNEITTFQINTDEKFFFRRGCLVGDRYYIPSANSDILMEFNITEKKISFHKMRNTKGAWSICYDGHDFWLPPRYSSDPFIRWNAERDEYTEITAFPDSYIDCDLNFIWVYNSGGYIHAIPELANMFVKINRTTLNMYKELQIQENKKTGFFFDSGTDIYLVLKGKNSPFFTQEDNQFLKLHKQTSEFSDFSFSLKNRQDLIRDFLVVSEKRMTGICGERKVFGLEEFITNIIKGIKTPQDAVESGADNGKKIWGKLVK